MVTYDEDTADPLKHNTKDTFIEIHLKYSLKIWDTLPLDHWAAGNLEQKKVDVTFLGLHILSAMCRDSLCIESTICHDTTLEKCLHISKYL